jgi:hypothetical protein
MENEGNYYAILTATVRHDKRLSSDEKLLYAEITALSNKYGFCWSSNDYLAKIFDCTVQSISRWISNLENFGYLKREIDKAAGNKRKLYPLVTYLPSQSSKHDLLTDQVIPINPTVNTPINSTVKYNSIIDNSIKEVKGKSTQTIFMPLAYERIWDIPVPTEYKPQWQSEPLLAEKWEMFCKSRFESHNARYASDVQESTAIKLFLKKCGSIKKALDSLEICIGKGYKHPDYYNAEQSGSKPETQKSTYDRKWKGYE